MAPVQPIHKSGRIDDIEALRAIAILFVVFHHLDTLITWLPNSKLGDFHHYFAFWTGVDLFFVISGFVIARELVPKLAAVAENSREQVWRTILAFWLKRAWRILPSAWAWIVLMFLGALVFNRSGVWGDLMTNFTGTITAFTQTANMGLWVCYARPTGCAANSIYWSLSLEEQFYILLPILCIVLRKHLLPVLGIIIIVQFFMHREPATFAWVVRSDALGLGVLLAIFSKNKLYSLFEPIFLRSPWAFIVPGILIVSLAALPIDGPTKRAFIPFSTGVIAIISAILVFIASYNRNYITRCLWIRKPLVMIGARSFALYLAHMPAYNLTRELWFRVMPAGTTFDGTYTWHFLLTSIFLMCLFTEITHRWIEIPMRKRGRQIAENFEQSWVPGSRALSAPEDCKPHAGLERLPTTT